MEGVCSAGHTTNHRSEEDLALRELDLAAATKEQKRGCHVAHHSMRSPRRNGFPARSSRRRFRKHEGPVYFTAPEVRPPMRRFSIKENRMITGTMATIAVVNRYCQSLM